MEGTGQMPEDVAGIIAADLRNSGKFNPIDVSRIPQQPVTSEVNLLWTALGIDSVVVGRVPSADGQYLVSYQLVDVAGSQVQFYLKVSLKCHLNG